MESFKWGPQFITDIPEIDTQHQALVGMINTFGESLVENSVSEDLLNTTSHELAKYVQFHFDTEERLMTEVGVDIRHMKVHLGQHYDFVRDISNLIEATDVEKISNCRTLFEYLVHWLAYHILGADKNMVRQIKAIKEGKNSEEAFLDEEKAASSATEPLLIALNGLFTLVSKRNKALFELSRNLEKRVAERTKELSEANKALHVISITDHLTQLPNRRYAMSQLELHWHEAVKFNLPLSCLMIDADGFKQINDTYGHDAGDVVLQTLASELRDSVRSDDIVCRLGGDEFFIICPNTDLEGALTLGQQTCSNVAQMKIPAGDGYWFGSVSIGVASRIEGMESLDDLMKSVDDAVYMAKKDGKSCVRSRLS
jgi:diguanylate cyclase (GGDEF)-like protein/hemerythrin-like metal-binding protein